MQTKPQSSADTSKQGSFFATRRGNEHNEVSVSVGKCRLGNGQNEAVDAAATIKTRLGKAIGREQALATRIALREYLPAIRAIREQVPVEVLTAELATLIGRLDTGWELEPTPSRTRLWNRLLLRYEVVSDCLEDDPTSETLGRIERRWSVC